jgi:hypothetical protein
MHCTVCEACFKSFRPVTRGESNTHQERYASLSQYAARGCRICKDLLRATEKIKERNHKPLTCWILRRTILEDGPDTLAVMINMLDLRGDIDPPLSFTFPTSPITANCPLSPVCESTQTKTVAKSTGLYCDFSYGPISITDMACANVADVVVNMANPKDPSGQIVDGPIHISGRMGHSTWTGSERHNDNRPVYTTQLRGADHQLSRPAQAVLNQIIEETDDIFTRIWFDGGGAVAKDEGGQSCFLPIMLRM